MCVTQPGLSRQRWSGQSRRSEPGEAASRVFYGAGGKDCHVVRRATGREAVGPLVAEWPLLTAGPQL